MLSAVPSPKFHDLAVILPLETVDKSVKFITWFKHTFVKLKSATGIGYTVIESFSVSGQPRLDE